MALSGPALATEPVEPAPTLSPYSLFAGAPAEEDLDLEARGEPEGAPPLDLRSLFEPEPRGWADPRRHADESVFAAVAGISVALGALSAKLEVRQLNSVVEGHWTTSSLALGPSLVVERGATSVTCAYLPELASTAISGAEVVAPRSSDAPRYATRCLLTAEF